MSTPRKHSNAKGIQHTRKKLHNVMLNPTCSFRVKHVRNWKKSCFWSHYPFISPCYFRIQVPSLVTISHCILYLLCYLWVIHDKLSILFTLSLWVLPWQNTRNLLEPIRTQIMMSDEVCFSFSFYTPTYFSDRRSSCRYYTVGKGLWYLVCSLNISL